MCASIYVNILYLNCFRFQVSLLLEYCSKGDLNSFLNKHRTEFEDSLMHFQYTGGIKLGLSTNSTSTPSDIRLLYRWMFQVIHIGRSHNPPIISYSTYYDKPFLDCRWHGIFGWKRNLSW